MFNIPYLCQDGNRWRNIKERIDQVIKKLFEKYLLTIETPYMIKKKQTMRHNDSSSLKDNVVDNFQKLSTKPYDETKNQKNNLAFTDDSRESRSIGPCLYKARCFNAFENIEFVVDTREETGKKIWQTENQHLCLYEKAS